jgi:hypothetical protein
MATNAWIEGYIDALVRAQQSVCQEHAHARAAASQMRAGEPVGEPIHGAPAVDADRRLYANYYVRQLAWCDALTLRSRPARSQVQQILRWDEDGIRRAWSKANASAGCAAG